MCLWIDVMNRFFARFMEQWIQKLHNSEQTGTEDCFPFPIVPHRSAPTTFPKKRVSNTSSDSGVNSPQVLLPAMPVTPDILQPYIMQSTSRLDPSRGPLTPTQQFIHSNSKSKNNEPKLISPSPIILTHSLCFELFLDKATNFKTS